MSTSSDEVQFPADKLNEALVTFTSCIGESLDGICSYSLIIGQSYVPFMPDADEDDGEACEDSEYGCNQAWVRVETVSTAATAGNTALDGTNCDVVWRLALEVGVLRCITIEGEGEAPTSSDLLEAAMQSMDDMSALHKAAFDCKAADDQPLWLSIEDGEWIPLGPLGGQYGGTWLFTVEFPTDYGCE